ncbi:hypothetical protein HPP92_025101 [Vanilla planifolia]|uniref:Uncharacterized protein n=1 Tax=Vanilla planifolia TaxID=51239 RepID=A0A835PLL8_VANPL|nr:hypothetical protein HPP92_025375 [Vanilla planifolia]KAG0453797.1 hypothetical protein HPP92_025101 [Vanilla planifolia]
MEINSQMGGTIQMSQARWRLCVSRLIYRLRVVMPSGAGGTYRRLCWMVCRCRTLITHLAESYEACFVLVTSRKRWSIGEENFLPLSQKMERDTLARRY